MTGNISGRARKTLSFSTLLRELLRIVVLFRHGSREYIPIAIRRFPTPSPYTNSIVARGLTDYSRARVILEMAALVLLTNQALGNTRYRIPWQKWNSVKYVAKSYLDDEGCAFDCGPNAIPDYQNCICIYVGDTSPILVDILGDGFDYGWRGWN
jgi:hypothetical protein